MALPDVLSGMEPPIGHDEAYQRAIERGESVILTWELGYDDVRLLQALGNAAIAETCKKAGRAVRAGEVVSLGLAKFIADTFPDVDILMHLPPDKPEDQALPVLMWLKVSDLNVGVAGLKEFIARYGTKVMRDALQPLRDRVDDQNPSFDINFVDEVVRQRQFMQQRARREAATQEMFRIQMVQTFTADTEILPNLETLRAGNLDWTQAPTELLKPGSKTRGTDITGMLGPIPDRPAEAQTPDIGPTTPPASTRRSGGGKILNPGGEDEPSMRTTDLSRLPPPYRQPPPRQGGGKRIKRPEEGDQKKD